ncbi:unnamed protein product [Cylicocyclus nassatus]|uniref:VWFA domain-containing protein n=1 Tax=Cylicocyclus nassatus TaxID=53992 RepID=A0AA36H7Y2_CYLNA|nr:unnamed protein product [Cylicocyclus nassatus]
MVFDASLGYDPDEWEECPPKEQFMVFSFFTRILLSSAAILFLVLFFHMLEKNKEKEEKKEKKFKKGEENDVAEPVKHSADLLKEAEEYMGGFVIKAKETLSDAAVQLKQHLPQELFHGHDSRQTFAQYTEEPRRRAEEAERLLKTKAEPTYTPEPLRAGQGFFTDSQPQEQFRNQSSEAPSQFSQPKEPPTRKISKEDQEALRLWELERERLEEERLAKLQDHEAGGEESELTSTGMLPASHISYDAGSMQEGEQKIRRKLPNTLPPQNDENMLEKRLMAQIGQIAEASPNVKRESYRDSELTDYDISDFHGNEQAVGYAPASTFARFANTEQTEHTKPTPAPITSADRNTTGDSDDFVKVNVDPIYDMPPNNEKGMSPEEAKKLQDLYKEYDFGSDIGPEVAQPTQQAFPTRSQFSPPVIVSPVAQDADVSGTPKFVPTDPASTQPIYIVDNGREDPRNVVNAEMYVADAIEYLGNQESVPSAGAFVIEEEMLSSQGSMKRPQQQQIRLPSGDPTSRQFKTMEVFDRVEHDEHDDITYAPEIQSVEIPPDQMSENSDNLQEYFDRAAAEGMEPHRLRDHKHTSLQKTPMAQAPYITSATARAQSASSLASGSSARSKNEGYPRLRKQSSLLSVLGVTSMQEMLLTIDSLDTLSDAMRKAGLENTNMIFGIDYTASNKYQGEDSFGGRSLHTIHPSVKNPYQQVITILGRTLAPFASTGRIPVFGFGDAKTGDWSVFPLKQNGDCTSLEEVLKIYNEVTPTVDLSGPTNFAPLIYQAMEICQSASDYHILVIIADGQVTNERATRRAIVQACQYPLSIIVVGVGDGPWEMMRVFDESLPKRPWDNFHFVEYHDIMRRTVGKAEGDVKLAVQSLLEIPDQYRIICELGLLKNRSIPPRGSEIRKEMAH